MVINGSRYHFRSGWLWFLFLLFVSNAPQGVENASYGPTATLCFTSALSLRTIHLSLKTLIAPQVLLLPLPLMLNWMSSKILTIAAMSWWSSTPLQQHWRRWLTLHPIARRRRHWHSSTRCLLAFECWSRRRCPGLLLRPRRLNGGRRTWKVCRLIASGLSIWQRGGGCRTSMWNRSGRLVTTKRRLHNQFFLLSLSSGSGGLGVHNLLLGFDCGLPEEGLLSQ